MIEKVIKELNGHSASKIVLLESDDIPFVRKTDNIHRNIERFDSLKGLNLSFPKIFRIEDNHYDMEYIQNIPIKQYLLYNSPDELIRFIKNTLSTLSLSTYDKDYSLVYRDKLINIDFGSFSFTKKELFDRLPKILPASSYLGDFTLENIIYNTNENRFYLIDPLTTEYDSYIFDISKLRQDLSCKWFIRNENLHISSKLSVIEKELGEHFLFDNSLTILMLLRIIPYSNNNDKQFLRREIEKLWK